MDSEINRWRNIATSDIYTHPQQKVVLLPRKQAATARGALSTTRPKHSSRKDIEPIGRILDRFAEQHKRDVSTLSSGHLNPNNANMHLERFKEGQRSHPRFGISTQPAATDLPVISIPNTRASGDTQRAAQPANDSASVLQQSSIHVAAARDDQTPGLGVGSMIDLLSKFDSVKMREKIHDAIDEPFTPQEPLKPTESEQQRTTRHFLPSYQLSLTKVDQFRTLQLIDKTVVQRNQSYLKNSDGGKLARLQQYQDFLRSELEANNCPDQGPDMSRLRVYSQCFEMLIAEFRTYAPIFAEIKARKQYDKTVLSFQSDQSELNFLRTKVQKLLSQNENRLLLKFERKKAKELEMQVEGLKAENERLKSDLRRKLAIYASYLPASLLHEKKKDDPLLAEVEYQIRNFGLGDDPISVAERQIEALKAEVNAKLDEIDDIKQTQEREFVPRITKEKIEESLHDIEEKLKRYIEKNNGLETQLMERQAGIRQLEATLREKEQQYQFLITEYK
ncbi:Clathrin heavy chain linker domain-containing protein 1 [Polyrhizophydium stewartii]|uniref:Clathrin heavy chain linker domain-containing protein 1 n=1 Tax=Polyrhizophydium stewartii TaxID=2732419 RepID=A0ABR4MY30_9FUNG